MLANLQGLVIIGSGLAAAYFGLKLCVGLIPAAKKRQILSFCLFSLGMMMGVGGWISTVRISCSPRTRIEGTIVELNQTQGRSSNSYFRVRSGGSTSEVLRCSYFGPRLKEGELIAATILEEYDAVLNLTVLSGPNSGWTLHENDDLLVSRITSYVGSAFFLVSFGIWLVPKAILSPEDDYSE